MSGGGIEAVLLRHVIWWEPRAYPSYGCECGNWDGAQGDNGGPGDGRNDNQQAATAHVAAAVITWLDARLAEGDVRETVAKSILSHEIATGFAADEWGDGADCEWLLGDATAALSAVRGVLGGEGS